MDTLNIEQYGVMEMDTAEMQKTNGGICCIILAALVIYLLTR